MLRFRVTSMAHLTWTAGQSPGDTRPIAAGDRRRRRTHRHGDRCHRAGHSRVKDRRQWVVARHVSCTTWSLKSKRLGLLTRYNSFRGTYFRRSMVSASSTSAPVEAADIGADRPVDLHPATDLRQCLLGLIRHDVSLRCHR
jgi:hypothetical protein